MDEKEDRSSGAGAVLGLFVAVGLIVGGLLVGRGFERGRAADRYVTVKGLAEREVPADLALWPIVFTATADDLGALQQRIDAGTAKVRAFLEPRFGGDEIGVSMPRITDREAQGIYDQGRKLERYAAEVTVTLRSGRIDALHEAIERSGELVKDGVAIIRSYEYQTQFLFTGLSDIKPEMIAEATLDARAAAQQFAEDSGSRLGRIRTAQQGYFSIEDRDAFSPEIKRIRVVTTVQYSLIDD